MSRITVKIYTTLGNKLVKGNYEVEARTVADALAILSERFGRAFEEIYLDGEVRNLYILLLNGKPCDRKKIHRTDLNEGDALHIFPPVSGG